MLVKKITRKSIALFQIFQTIKYFHSKWSGQLSRYVFICLLVCWNHDVFQIITHFLRSYNVIIYDNIKLTLQVHVYVTCKKQKRVLNLADTIKLMKRISVSNIQLLQYSHGNLPLCNNSIISLVPWKSLRSIYTWLHFVMLTDDYTGWVTMVSTNWKLLCFKVARG